MITRGVTILTVLNCLYEAFGSVRITNRTIHWTNPITFGKQKSLKCEKYNVLSATALNKAVQMT